MSKKTTTADRLSHPLPGNDGVRAQLAQLAVSGRLHTCLMFEGPPGLGKAGVALWLAQLANCDDVDGMSPCGACWSCRHIPKDQHPDVIRIGPDPTKKSGIISVEQARELLGRLKLRPYNARRRMVIIEPAEAMTTAAANAMLKTFEEPPGDTGFVLITHRPAALLATVRSRSLRVRFGPVAPAVLTQWLTERGVDDAASLAVLADGCPGHALALADGEMDQWRAARDELLLALAGDITGFFAYGQSMVKGDRSRWMRRFELTLVAVERLLRDALVELSGARLPCTNLDRPEIAAAWAESLGLGGLSRVSDAVSRARADAAAFVTPRLMLDAFVTRLATELGSARLVGGRSP